LTQKYTSFYSRNWELKHQYSFDITDPMLTDTVVISYQGVLYSVSTPINNKFNHLVNDSFYTGWITDKARLFIDSIYNIKKRNQSEIGWIDWENKFQKIKNYLYFNDFVSNFGNKNFFYFVFNNVTVETINLISILSTIFPFIKIRKLEESKETNLEFESNFQINNLMKKSKLLESDVCLLLGSYTKHESAKINLNLRQRYFKGNFKLLSIGSILDFTIPITFIGSNVNKTIKSLLEGKNSLCLDLKNSKKPFLIKSSELSKRYDVDSFVSNFNLLTHSNFITKNWNGINNINSGPNQIISSIVNKFLHITSSDLNNATGIYLINTDVPSISNIKKLTEIKVLKYFNKTTKKNILQKNLYDQNSLTKSLTSDLIENYNYTHLPNSLFFQSNETFINTEGFIKRTNKIMKHNDGSKNDWQLIRKFIKNIDKFTFINNNKKNLYFNSENLYNFRNYINFHYYATNVLTSLNFFLNQRNKPIQKNINLKFKQSSSKLMLTKIKHWLDDFFIGGKDDYSRHSSLIINCSKNIRFEKTNFF
jgi:NADH dehydrogenase/NADH:ubiquinone oxidoreductase subunit G